MTSKDSLGGIKDKIIDALNSEKCIKPLISQSVFKISVIEEAIQGGENIRIKRRLVHF